MLGERACCGACCLLATIGFHSVGRDAHKVMRNCIWPIFGRNLTCYRLEVHVKYSWHRVKSEAVKAFDVNVRSPLVGRRSVFETNHLQEVSRYNKESSASLKDYQAILEDDHPPQWMTFPIDIAHVIAEEWSRFV